MPIRERDFFTERTETRPAHLTCPRCRRGGEYTIRWVRRVKKPQIPRGADARDRAIYGKLRDHLFRIDDEVTCSSCRRRFEIPSQQSLVFL